MASSRMSGGQFVAGMLKGYGLTHVFCVESILRQTLIELEQFGTGEGFSSKPDVRFEDLG
jgi:hypothetical protein